MARKKEELNTYVIEDKWLGQNTIFLGDRKEIFPKVREKAKNLFGNVNVFEKREVHFFEIEKLNISIDDIRRMISFVNKTSEGQKVVMLSSFYWMDEAQNGMLKVLEETPPNTFIYIFGLHEKNFLSTILSRVGAIDLSGINKYFDDAYIILQKKPNERLENKTVKKILSLKTVDVNYEKDVENEKKDREEHILFLNALMEVVLFRKEELKLNKDFLEKILHITTLSDIEGGSPHLFIEWLLLSTPQLQ